ncbi:MAG: hypothetical protein ACRDRX_11355 [Pseudonocardiaceae bacterium]
MTWETLVRFKHFQQFAGLPVPPIPMIVKRSGQVKREGQINNGVNLTRQALINVECQLEMPLQRDGRLLSTVELSEADT